ncbi:MAG: glycosyl transferase, group 1 [Mucilaginibacter sp.]|nr:glycosyl transferase, group 1 [Mucilaginibacter sp.]
MRIAIDGIRLSRKPSGVTFILISIIKQLAVECPEWDIYVLLRTNIHPSIEQIFFEKNIYLVISPSKFFNNISMIWSLFKLNTEVRKVKPDYFFSPNSILFPLFLNKNIKNIVFVHDLVFRVFPETMSKLNRIQMMLLFRFSLRNASIIWCNSNYTKSELSKYYFKHINKKQVFVGAGLNIDFKEALKKNKNLNKINSGQFKKPVILFVGTIEPRKNVRFLLRIFEQVSNAYDLIIVGAKGWGDEEKAIHSILSEHQYPRDSVTLLRSVELETLVGLYSNASFYMTTAINEGLGLPLLEAMASGCPVIAPDNSAMAEVIGDAGIKVKSWNIQDWLAAIYLMEADRDRYIGLGYNRIANYSWDDVVKSFVKILQ